MKSNYDLKICCLNFNMPTKGTKKPMDENSFRTNVHNNPEFRKDLREGKLLGLFTHSGRYYDKLDKTIPYSDNIAKSPNLANVIVAEDIVGPQVHLDLKLIDKPEGGALVRQMIKDGINVGVSMSTHCDPFKTDKYYITKLLGVDFTLDPAFLGTGILEKNFSDDLYLDINTSLLGGTSNSEIINFSLNAEILDCTIPKGNIYQIPFSIEGYESISNINDYFVTASKMDTYLFDKKNLKERNITFEELVNEGKINPQHFSLLKQMIVESGYPPYRRLNRRIEELAREIKGKSEEYITKYKDVFFNYINDPIYNWISKAFNSDKRVMLAIGLRLGKFVKDSSVVTKADRKLENIRRKRKSMNGIFDKTSQKELDEVLKELFGEIWKYIEEISNTNILSKEGLKAVLQNYDATKTDYKTVEEWLDAGSDGVKDYNIWVNSFPYKAKDVEEHKNKKVFYGYKETDELILALSNNSLDEKGKNKLVAIMEDQNINNNFSSTFLKNFDNENVEENKNKMEDLARRTMTDADADAIAEKVMDSLKEKGILPEEQPPQEEEQMEAPVEQQQDETQQEQPPQEQEQQQQEQPPQQEGNTPQADMNRFPKPKVITSQEASKLTGVNFSERINISNLSKIPLKIKQRLISFSVLENIDSNIDQNSVDIVYFSLGVPYGISRDFIDDIIFAKKCYSQNLISEKEFSDIKESMKQELILEYKNV